MSLMPIDDYLVFRDDDSELGGGQFGRVFKGRHVPTNTEVAVKRVELRDTKIQSEVHSR